MIGDMNADPDHPLLVTKDHVVPVMLHGGDDENVVLSCKACNTIKGSMSPTEWDSFRQRVPEWWKLYRYLK
jgi:5-methylcytosine-specific restriction endonuclease McrA